MMRSDQYKIVISLHDFSLYWKAHKNKDKDYIDELLPAATSDKYSKSSDRGLSL